MKQAKFALTAVAVLAVVGGALAFKASRGNNLPVYIQETGKLQCTFPTILSNRTTVEQGAPISTFFSTTSTTKPCPSTVVYELQ